MKQTSQQQLVAILRYDEANTEIDNRKCFEWDIETYSKAPGFTVNYRWYAGVTTDSENDPTIEREPRYMPASDSFTILLSESLNKLRREIEDMFEKVNKEEFKEERF